MIVSQADYERWQHMYGKSEGVDQAHKSDDSQPSSQKQEGQNFAIESAKTDIEGTGIAPKEKEKSFLEQAFERVLLNRLGIDQGKMDELKEEIENTEKAIEVLEKKEPRTQAQETELGKLKDKLDKLNKALEELIEQANERANKDDKQTNTDSTKSKEKSAAQYKSIASFI